MPPGLIPRRKVWLGDMEEDSREMGNRVWRREARDRNEWATIVRQSLAPHGL